MQLNQAVSERLKELLAEKNMTNYALFKRCGVPKSTIGNLVNCTYDSVVLRVLHELCQGLGISFVSDTLVRNVPADKHICFYKLDASCSVRDLCFFRKKAKYVTRAVREFLSIAEELATP